MRHYCIASYLLLLQWSGGLYAQAPKVMSQDILNNKINLQCSQSSPLFGATNDGRDFFLGMIFPSFSSVMPASLRPFSKCYALVTSYYETDVAVSYFAPNGTEQFSTVYHVN